MPIARITKVGIGRAAEYWRFFISVFILAIIFLQGGTTAIGFGIRTYPFINYRMYTNVHNEGENLDVEYPLYMELTSGEEVLVAASDVGMNFFKLDRYLNRILNGRTEEAQMLMALYESRTGQTVTGLRIESYPAIITREGVVPVQPETLYALRRDSSWSDQ